MKILPSHALDLLSVSIHLPMDWKCSHFFFQLWSTPMISTPCSLTFILFKRTPIHLPSLFKENCPLSVHSTKSRVHSCRKLCFQTVSIMGQSHFHSFSHVHRRKPLPVWMQTSTTAACVGHCKSAKLAHFHHEFFYSQMDLYQLTAMYVLCMLLQPCKVIQESSTAHLKTTPRRKWEFHRFEGFAEWQLVCFVDLWNYVAGGNGSFLGEGHTLISPWMRN